MVGDVLGESKAAEDAFDTRLPTLALGEMEPTEGLEERATSLTSGALLKLQAFLKFQLHLLLLRSGGLAPSDCRETPLPHVKTERVCRG